MNIKTVGSVCLGIEATSVAWQPLGFNFKRFSKIDEFASKVLEEPYPNKVNVEYMNDLPDKIINNDISSSDLICEGIPCQTCFLDGLKRFIWW